MSSTFSQKIRAEIIKLLKTAGLKISAEKILAPPNREMGDFSVAVFQFAGGKNPAEFAQKTVDKIKGKYKLIKHIEAVGPYINFFINEEKQAETILTEKIQLIDKPPKTIMVEYAQPNTNKPLHIGHGRNIFLAMAITNILKEKGHEVITANLINDRGIHITKSIIAYAKKGQNKTPASEKIKGDHFVGKYYVLFNELKTKNPSIEKEAQEMLRKWEAEDKEIRALWKKMNKWVISGLRETFAKIGANFDVEYFESEIYQEGKNIVLAGLKKKKLVKKDGAVYANLDKYNLPEKVLLRSDGTTLYMTQDLYLATKKFQDYNLDESIYIVASEQDLHFKQLFAILDKLGTSKGKILKHISYGMVNLEGGKIKSREGKTADLDGLIDVLEKMALREIKIRNKKISLAETKKRSEIIALAALKYYILKYNPKSTVNFNAKKAMSFNGDTGPYLLYSYARIVSILKKAGKYSGKIDYSLFNTEAEKNLISQLTKFPDALDNAASEYDPSEIAKYLYELAKNFHSFYHKIPVLKAKLTIKKARIALILKVSEVLKEGLKLLGIEFMEEM